MNLMAASLPGFDSKGIITPNVFISQRLSYMLKSVSRKVPSVALG